MCVLMHKRLTTKTRHFCPGQQGYSTTITTRSIPYSFFFLIIGFIVVQLLCSVSVFSSFPPRPLVIWGSPANPGVQVAAALRSNLGGSECYSVESQGACLQGKQTQAHSDAGSSARSTATIGTHTTDQPSHRTYFYTRTHHWTKDLGVGHAPVPVKLV